jgi:hypothetical protein
MQHPVIKTAQRTDRDDDRAPTQLLLPQQVQEVNLQLLVRDQLGRTMIVSGQSRYAADVTVARQRGQPAQLSLVEELLTYWSHDDRGLPPTCALIHTTSFPPTSAYLRSPRSGSMCAYGNAPSRDNGRRPA